MIEVDQMIEPNSVDFVNVRRLPVPLDMIEDCIQNTLHV